MIRHAVLVALVAGALIPCTSDDQAYFAILAETKVGRMAGMPPIDIGDLPPGFKLPPEAMMFSGKPVRALSIRLWSPSIAPPDATASVVPPDGLKQGKKLDLALYRPEGTSSGRATQDFDPDSNPEFTIKIYWGSSETVKDGQPKIIKWAGLTDEQKEAMKQQAREARAGSSYFYKAGWTTGYWPTKSQAGSIDANASLVGKYSLTTSYTGNVEIEAPADVDFLAGIQMSSPNLDKKIDLKKAIKFKWDPIEHALGLNASIIGMEGKNTLIIWSSSEVFAEGLMGDMGYLQMAEVRDYVEKTMFMAGDRTSVDVPAGIFQNADMAMCTMAGYGPGAALAKAQPLPRIQTKTTLQLMLGGKKMTGFDARR
ncbi:MAG: hypothetical protein M9921_08750 [Fimbriimonadaceae bacterium]|nr:hypothetical protein [Chthonomonadaceae bacterium]MCO5296932.1 hypothetical protein [Fimbriimonadaceae bacterium]